MANEASVKCGLTVKKGNIDYAGKPTSFNADVTGTIGPAPGAFTASLAGTSVDLSEFTTPGLCRVQNIDATNYVTWGIWDPESELFYPLGEILAGESYVIRLSRLLSGELGTGAGTVGANTNTFMFKSNTAACVVLVEAFEV